MVFGVAAIDQEISRFEIGRDLLNDRIHRRTGLDHHQDPARVLKLADEILKAGGTNDLLARSKTGKEFFRFGVGAVVHHTRETIALSVENQVLAHHAETDQAEMGLVHGAVRCPMRSVWRRPPAA